MSRADGAADAGWQAFVSIDMSEPDVEAESDRCVLVGQHDEIAHTHGSVIKRTLESAGKAWGKIIHRKLGRGLARSLVRAD